MAALQLRIDQDNPGDSEGETLSQGKHWRLWENWKNAREQVWGADLFSKRVWLLIIQVFCVVHHFSMAYNPLGTEKYFPESISLRYIN